MVDGVFCLAENMCQTPALLAALGQAADDAHARIEAQTDISELQRGVRHGALAGMVSGACLAHALALPCDHIIGTGPSLLPATWAHHRALLGGGTNLQQDPFVTYGAPRGLIGPLVAGLVGFSAGTVKVVGMLLGASVGLLTSPILLIYGGHSADFKAHIKHHKQMGGNFGFRLGSAATALSTAATADAARLPTVALKAAAPLVGGAMGCCIGSIQGLRAYWPGDTAAWVAGCGQGASAMSQQGLVIALEVAYLGFWRQLQVGA